jgi:hypothetical protein
MNCRELLTAASARMGLVKRSFPWGDFVLGPRGSGQIPHENTEFDRWS